MSGVVIEDISLNVSDGTTMAAFAARPKDTASFPAIIVFQEAYGVNAHIRDVTERLAAEGFVAVAPELFHRTAPGFEGDYNNFESVRKHVQAVTNEGLTADIIAVHNWLQNDARILHDKIASIGFCMGGRASFLANTAVKLNAAVSFYGGGIDGILDRVNDMQAPQLMFWGGQDAHIGQDQISSVTKALKEKNKKYANVVFSDAGHGFFCDLRSSYNPNAAKQAWALTLEFLNSYVNP